MLSRLLLVLVGCSLISPVLVAKVRPDVPACCKRNGAHQCAMKHTAAPSNSDGTDVGVTSSNCSEFPNTVSLSSSAHAISFSKPLAVGEPVYQACDSADRKTRCANRSKSTANGKRGPPSLLS
jgi:hypothetical protein